MVHSEDSFEQCLIIVSRNSCKYTMTHGELPTILSCEMLHHIHQVNCSPSLRGRVRVICPSLESFGEKRNDRLRHHLGYEITVLIQRLEPWKRFDRYGSLILVS